MSGSLVVFVVLMIFMELMKTKALFGLKNEIILYL